MNNAEARQLRLQAERAAARRERRLATLRSSRRAEVAQRERDEARRQAAVLAQRARAPTIADRGAALVSPDRSQVSRTALKRTEPRQSPSFDKQSPKPRFKPASGRLSVPGQLPPRARTVKSRRIPPVRVALPREAQSQPGRAALPSREKPPSRNALTPREKPVPRLPPPRTAVTGRPARRTPSTPKTVAVRTPQVKRRDPTRAPLPLAARAVSGKLGARRSTPESKWKPVPRSSPDRKKRVVALTRERGHPRLAEPPNVRKFEARAPVASRPVARPTARSTRSALPAVADPRPKAREAPESERGISWLSTKGNLVLGEDGVPVLLRGVNVVGLDDALASGTDSPGDALGLTHAAVDLLADTWGANLVRVPISVATILGGDATLTALDDLVAVLTDAGLYTLLALSAPLSSGRAAPPDDITFAALGLIAARYRDSPGVLFELFASQFPQPEGWQEMANRLIGAVRMEHPVALVLLSGESGGNDVTGLPIRFATGDPVHNAIYTVRFEAGRSPAASDARFHSFARSYPLLASPWSNGGGDLGRSAELAGQLFNRYGIGWVAAHWNAEPRLVRNAAKGQFAPTRFGLDALRALALPVRLALPPSATAFGIASAVQYWS